VIENPTGRWPHFIDGRRDDRPKHCKQAPWDNQLARVKRTNQGIISACPISWCPSLDEFVAMTPGFRYCASDFWNCGSVF
jgi:hypothetical protein